VKYGQKSLRMAMQSHPRPDDSIRSFAHTQEHEGQDD
jgi:hypothetical protein